MVDVADCADVQVGLLPLEFATGRTDDEAAAAGADLEDGSGVWPGSEGGRRGEREKGRGGDGKRGFRRAAVLGVRREKGFRGGKRGDRSHSRWRVERRRGEKRLAESLRGEEEGKGRMEKALSTGRREIWGMGIRRASGLEDGEILRLGGGFRFALPDS